MLRVDVPTVQAAAWAWRELRRLRQVLPQEGLQASARRPPPLPEGAARGVLGVAWLGRATCLERSIILQSWASAHGRDYDIVVGVDPAGSFRAHAWLEEFDGPQPEYLEITRKPAR